jgi:hypothetical protein
MDTVQAAGTAGDAGEGGDGAAAGGGPPLFSAAEAEELLGWLEGLRARRRLDHSTFARQVLGVSPPTWSKIYRGHRRISQGILDRLFVDHPAAVQRYVRDLRARAARGGAAA